MAVIRTIKTVFTGDSTGLGKSAGEGEKAISGWAKSVQAAGKAATMAAAAAGAAIAAAITAGIASSLASTKSNALLSAQLGATPKQAEELGRESGTLWGKGLVDSVEEANDAIRAVIQNGLASKNAPTAFVDSIAEQVVTLTKTLEEDSSRITGAVKTMLATGIVKSAQEAFDVLQRGAELGVNKAQDLIDTFTEYPTEFRKLGLSAEQTLGILSQGLQNGARDSDKVADALKEFGIRAIDGSVLTAQGFKLIGLNAKQMAAQIAKGGPSATKALDETLDRLRAIKDPVLQAQAATALFGTQAEDLGKALFALDPSSALTAVGNVDGAVKAAGATLEDTAANKVEVFKRAIQTGVVAKLGEAVTWIEKNQTAAKTLGVVLAGIAAVVLTVGTAVKVYQAAVAIATAVQWAWNVALAASGIGLVVIAIALLVAGIFLLWNNSEAFRKFFIAAWDDIKKAVGAAIDWITGPAWSGIKTALGWIEDKATTVGNAVSGFFGTVGDVISGQFNTAVSLAKGFINALIRQTNAGIAGINKLADVANHIPGVNIPHIPSIPLLAKGGPVVAGRSYIVGDAGPEILTAGFNGRVTSNSKAFGPGSDSGPDVLHLEVPIQIGDEVVRVVKMEIDLSDRAKRRRALAGAGAR